jgi:hypothetical protein
VPFRLARSTVFVDAADLLVEVKVDSLGDLFDTLGLRFKHVHNSPELLIAVLLALRLFIRVALTAHQAANLWIHSVPLESIANLVNVSLGGLHDYGIVVCFPVEVVEVFLRVSFRFLIKRHHFQKLAVFLLPLEFLHDAFAVEHSAVVFLHAVVLDHCLQRRLSFERALLGEQLLSMSLLPSARTFFSLFHFS